MSSTNKHILLVGSWVCSSATKVSVPRGWREGRLIGTHPVDGWDRPGGGLEAGRWIWAGLCDKEGKLW